MSFNDSNHPPKFKELIAQAIVNKAKELAWNSIKKSQQKVSLKEAKALHNEELKQSTIRITKKVSEVMEQESYISSVDPSASLDEDE